MAPLQNDVDTLVTGMENLAVADPYWASEECMTKLDQSFVSRRCLERWAEMLPFPHDMPDLSMTMQATRNFFLALLQRGNANTFHNSWAKACALFDVTMQALVNKNSSLVDDVVLVTTVVLGIARKDETSAASGCYGDLLQVAAMFEDQLGRPRKMRTVKELKDAEFEIFAVLDWTLPQTDTYTCISAILLRMDILTRGEHKPQLETAWQHAVQKCVRAVMLGVASGYATAYHIVRDSLEDVGFEQAFLDPLMREAAPEPLKAAVQPPFLPPLRCA
jgi:hypothetical protein